MKLGWILLGLLGLPIAVPSPAVAAADLEIAAVYNELSDDRGFNALFLSGVTAFETQRRLRVRRFGHPLHQVFEGSSLERFVAAAVDDGVSALVFAGANTFGNALTVVAQRYPQVKLVAIDTLDASQLGAMAVGFRFEEATFLAGLVAARHSRAGKIGFVGGLDMPAIRSYGCAFAAGARRARPQIVVEARMVGRHASAFSDPVGGRVRAQELLTDGADVIFHAAGGSGLGVLAAVAEAGAYGIGVDANQNGLHPGRILTSVLKRVDVAVYTALVALHDGSWAPRTQSVGLAEGAVGLAMDEHNRLLIDDALRAELEEVEFAIVAGEIEVPTTRKVGEGCEFLDFPEHSEPRLP